MQNMWINRTY